MFAITTEMNEELSSLLGNLTLNPFEASIVFEEEEIQGVLAPIFPITEEQYLESLNSESGLIIGAIRIEPDTIASEIDFGGLSGSFVIRCIEDTCDLIGIDTEPIPLTLYDFQIREIPVMIPTTTLTTGSLKACATVRGTTYCVILG
jgi:hypothetical protein